eukprot:COSAG01_NODE_3731_length_5755_cov_6.626414_8_plen_71_part_00
MPPAPGWTEGCLHASDTVHTAAAAGARPSPPPALVASVPWLACCNQGLTVAAASLPFRVDDRLQLPSDRT